MTREHERQGRPSTSSCIRNARQQMSSGELTALGHWAEKFDPRAEHVDPVSQSLLNQIATQDKQQIEAEPCVRTRGIGSAVFVVAVVSQQSRRKDLAMKSQQTSCEDSTHNKCQSLRFTAAARLHHRPVLPQGGTVRRKCPSGTLEHARKGCREQTSTRNLPNPKHLAST